jgi:DNA recombination protein RmuC
MFRPMTSIDIVLLVFVVVAVAGAAMLYHKLQLIRASSQNDSDRALERFKQMASESLAANSEQFLMQARGLVEREGLTAKADIERRNLEFSHLIIPLTKKLEEYQTQLQGLERERVKSYSTVEQELKHVVELSASLSKETAALKNALKKPHVRGRWGEVQLKNCIELAGMSEYADVTFQDSQVTDDGQRLIPDLTVRMPGGRIVIVDAKTPIDAFLASLEAPDGDLRTAELARHGRHVKDHIKKLSVKSYSENLKNSADFTVMFLPNESFLYAALESEPDLVEFAIQKKILIATPPTFIGLLKVIRFGWNEERLAENAQKISEAGIELHRRVADFVEAYLNVGKSLDRAKQEFEVGLTRMQSRILPQAKKLEQLGAKSNKELLGVEGLIVD